MPPRKRRRAEYAQAAALDGDSSDEWGRGGREEDKTTQRTAGAALLDQFLGLYAQCKISAMDLAIACHNATLAGVPGADFERYALAPGQSSSGAYQRRLDTVLPDAGPLYHVDIPCVARHTSARARRPVPTMPAHEAIAAEVQQNPGLLEQAAATQWPPCFYEHRLVKRAVDLDEPAPLPLALYVDGVRYTAPLAGRTDSIVGFWLINLATSKRHILCGLRSSEMCRCGCRGWCTVQPILQSIAWGLRALASGRRPTRRHDGAEFPLDDPLAAMSAKCGRELPFRAFLLSVKGDWGEVAHSLALAPVTAKHGPCPFCKSTQRHLHTGYRAVTVNGFSDQLHRSADEYHELCSQLEHVVLVSTEQERALLLNNMRYLKGDSGRGRTLVRDVPQFLLRAKDRLEPSDELADVSFFDDRPLPFRAVFWRPTYDAKGSRMDPVHHRNPLFAEDLATSPVQCLAVDTLHTLYYGPVMRWVSAVVWRVLLANPWGFRGAKKAKLELACRQLRGHLRAWSVEAGIAAGDRLGDLTLSMLGGEPAPEGCMMKTKAAETGMLMPWALRLLQEYEPHIDCADELTAAGNALVDYMAILRSQPMIMPRHKQQECLDACLRHLVNAERAGLHMVPKHHQFVHLTLRLQHHGNPRWHSTFLDESLNIVLRTVCAAAHRARMQSRIFHLFALQAQLGLAPFLFGPATHISHGNG